MFHSLENPFHVEIPLKNVRYCTQFIPVKITYPEVYACNCFIEQHSSRQPWPDLRVCLNKLKFVGYVVYSKPSTKIRVDCY